MATPVEDPLGLGGHAEESIAEVTIPEPEPDVDVDLQPTDFQDAETVREETRVRRLQFYDFRDQN